MEQAGQGNAGRVRALSQADPHTGAPTPHVPLASTVPLTRHPSLPPRGHHLHRRMRHNRCTPHTCHTPPRPTPPAPPRLSCRCITDFQYFEPNEERFIAQTTNPYWEFGAQITGGWVGRRAGGHAEMSA